MWTIQPDCLWVHCKVWGKDYFASPVPPPPPFPCWSFKLQQMSVLTYTPHTAHSCNQLTLSVPRAFPTILCFLITLLLFSFFQQLSSSILSARKLWMFSCFSRSHSLTLLQEPSVFVKLISNHDKPVSESNVAVERRTPWDCYTNFSCGESVEEETVGSEAAVIWALFELKPGVCELPPPPRSAPQLKSNDWMPDIPGQSVQ